MPRRLPTALLGLAVIVGVSGACGDDGGAAGDGGPLVIATTSVLGDVVESIVGDDATVEVLIPAGTDPHDFEPSARQAAELRDASLIVANGLGLEAGFTAALDAAADDGVMVLEVAPMLEPLPFGGGSAHSHDADAADADADDSADTGDEHDDVGDPHFWHDPLRMADAVPLIVDALVAVEPSLDTSELDARAAALVEALGELDEEIITTLDAVPSERRFLVTSHDTLGYFADRYDFEVIGVVIPGGDTLASPSAADLVGLVDEIRAHDLPAIFAENIGSTALADTLAEEVGRGVAVVSLFTDALGEPGSGADTYVGMLRTNAALVADALG